MSTFLDTLADIESRYDELEQLMADPTVTPITCACRRSAANARSWTA